MEGNLCEVTEATKIVKDRIKEIEELKDHASKQIKFIEKETEE